MTRKKAIIQLILHTIMCMALTGLIVSGCLICVECMNEAEMKEMVENSSSSVSENENVVFQTSVPQITNFCKDLTDVNPDVTAKLTVSGIGLKDEPVMHTPADQNAYLYKDINGEYSKAGSLFTAADAVIGKTNVSTIYGHSMGNGTMFGKLKQYRDIDFATQNQFFTVTTLFEKFNCQVVAVCDVSCDYANSGWYYPQANLNDEEMSNFLYQFKTRSYFISDANLNNNDKFVVLSTCAYAFEGERLIVVARIVDENVEKVNFSKNPLVLRANEYYETKNLEKPSDEKVYQNYINNIQ